MKRCAKCKNKMKLSNFNWKKFNNKRASYCKKCSREYIREHYRNNKQYYVIKARERNQTVKKYSYKYILEYLKSHPCEDCGENDILVLEFDHKNKAGKFMAVSRIMTQTGSLKRLKIEISKCEVRCANCHRRKTALENNSWKVKYAPVA